MKLQSFRVMILVLTGVLFLTVVAACAETADRYVLLGVTNAKQGNLTQATLDFTKAIEINPNLAEAYNNRVILYLVVKEYDKAWADVHKAEELGAIVKPEIINLLKKVSGRGK